MDGKLKKISKYFNNNELSIETANTFLNSILQNSRDVIYRYNFQTQCYDFISDSIEALTGYTPQEIHERGVDHLLQSLHPDDKPEFMKFYDGLVSNSITDSTAQIEYRVRRKDQTYVWLNDVISIIRDKSGQIQATVGAIRNVTAQKKYEQELKSSQERFKRLSEATFEGICIHDQGRIIDGNINLLEMFGLNSVDEFIGANCFDFIAPEYHKLVRQKISAGDVDPYEVLALRKDGTTFPIQIRARVCKWEGKPVRIATFRDLTKRNQREQELKESQERFKRLAEAAFEGICIHDGKEILDANQRFLDMLGVESLDDVKNTDCFNFIAPECHETAREKISKKIQEPYASIALKTDGSRIPIQIHARECMWNGKQVRIATFRDLTDQEQREQELRASQGRFKHLFENGPDAIFIADVETGLIVETNTKASELLGIPAEEIIGMHQAKLHPPEYAEKYREIFQKHVQDQSSMINDDIYVQHKDGRKIPIQINASIISVGNQRLIYGIFRDITDQKKLMNDIAARETHFKRLSEAAFEAIAIHEQGNIIDVNKQYLDMFGYTLQEVKAMPGIEMIAPESRALVEEKMASKYEGAYKAFGMKKDGTIFPVEIQAKESIIDGKPIRIGAIRDMTEQMQQIELLNAVFESSQDCIIVFDKDYNHLYMNQTARDFAETITGHPATGNMLDSLPYAPEFLNTWKDRIANAFITGKPQDFEDNFLRGEQVFYSFGTLAPVRCPGGEIFAVSLVFRDITELKASELRYKRLAEATFEGIGIHDFNRYFEANQQLLDMFGYTLEELLNENRTYLVAPDCREKAKKLAESKHEGPFELTCQKKDGSLFPAEFRAKNISINNTPCRIIAVRDLTTQKKLLKDLAESEENYKQLYYNAQAALYRTEIESGKILACSEALARMHGFETVEECIEQHHGTNHYVNKKRRKELLNSLYKNKRVENFEYQIKRLDGSTAWLSLTAEIFPEKGWIEGVITDITPTKILTPTEMKILKILLSGKSNKEIAYGLNRSVRTIEDHRAHIMNKLGVENVVDMTRLAIEYGIEPDGE